VVGKAASVNNVLSLDLESSWIVDLLEVSSEVPGVVVLPLDEPTDLVCKLGIRDVVASLVHRPLVAMFEGWSIWVIPQTSSLVTSLLLVLAANNIEYESVTRDLLTMLDLDDIPSLDGPPITLLKVLVPLSEDELLNRFAVHFGGSLQQIFVMQQVQKACSYDTYNSDKDDV
jgi:hypothetical protein